MKKLTALLLSLLCVWMTVLPVSANAPHNPPGTDAPLPAGTTTLVLKCFVVLLLLGDGIALFFLLRGRHK